MINTVDIDCLNLTNFIEIKGGNILKFKKYHIGKTKILKIKVEGFDDLGFSDVSKVLMKPIKSFKRRTSETSIIFSDSPEQVISTYKIVF